MLKPASAARDTRLSRLAALKKRHEELAEKIDGTRTHHRSISDFYLAELKKQKLHLKDMIEELAAQVTIQGGDAMRA